jgi:hypothetical protein
MDFLLLYGLIEYAVVEVAGCVVEHGLTTYIFRDSCPVALLHGGLERKRLLLVLVLHVWLVGLDMLCGDVLRFAGRESMASKPLATPLF